MVVEQRRDERQAARMECLRLLSAMDDIEKFELLKGDKDKIEVKVEVSCRILVTFVS